ncbi:hypothetical protein B6N60_02049 [Richelia sinica FACHB-800]|uniref:Uncharacterized protein n=1 Tax=Richelia sinica FACHB-800 TaxID=1357546 RepID=A0A975T748_9NOST|nr:hypothetical protein B6N60_02049 [Richelia sinica FACHB-800]
MSTNNNYRQFKFHSNVTLVGFVGYELSQVVKLKNGNIELANPDREQTA